MVPVAVSFRGLKSKSKSKSQLLPLLACIPLGSAKSIYHMSVYLLSLQYFDAFVFFMFSLSFMVSIGFGFFILCFWVRMISGGIQNACVWSIMFNQNWKHFESSKNVGGGTPSLQWVTISKYLTEYSLGNHFHFKVPQLFAWLSILPYPCKHSQILDVKCQNLEGGHIKWKS